MKASEVIARLEAMANPEFRVGMERFAIKTSNALGIRMPVLRSLSKSIGKDQERALELWKSSWHEAHFVAAFTAEPKKFTPQLMDAWIRDFDSWDICDVTCAQLFTQLPWAWEKAMEWCDRKKEFEKRSGFALMAALAYKDKKAKDEQYVPFFTIIEREAWDERNFVKKAVNWALRQLGKRNRWLNGLSIECASRIAEQDTPSARWIASDALRELRSLKVQQRLG